MPLEVACSGASLNINGYSPNSGCSPNIHTLVGFSPGVSLQQLRFVHFVILVQKYNTCNTHVPFSLLQMTTVVVGPHGATCMWW